MADGDIELKDLNDDNEAAEENAATGEEETDLGGTSKEGDDLLKNNDPNKSIQILQEFNSELGEQPAATKTNVGIKRRVTEDRKRFIRDAAGANLKKGTGPNSTILFDNLELTNDQRTGKNNGAKYKKVKIRIVKKGEYDYTTDTKYQKIVDEFKETLKKAQEEYSKTLEGGTEKILVNAGLENPAPELIDTIIENTTEQLKERLEEVRENVLEVCTGGLTRGR